MPSNGHQKKEWCVKRAWEELDWTFWTWCYMLMLFTEEEVSWSKQPEDAIMLVNWQPNQLYKNPFSVVKSLPLKMSWEESTTVSTREEVLSKKKTRLPEPQWISSSASCLSLNPSVSLLISEGWLKVKLSHNVCSVTGKLWQEKPMMLLQKLELKFWLSERERD